MATKRRKAAPVSQPCKLCGKPCWVGPSTKAQLLEELFEAVLAAQQECARRLEYNARHAETYPNDEPLYSHPRPTIDVSDLRYVIRRALMWQCVSCMDRQLELADEAVQKHRPKLEARREREKKRDAELDELLRRTRSGWEHEDEAELQAHAYNGTHRQLSDGKWAAITADGVVRGPYGVLPDSVKWKESLPFDELGAELGEELRAMAAGEQH